MTFLGGSIQHMYSLKHQVVGSSSNRASAAEQTSISSRGHTNSSSNNNNRNEPFPEQRTLPFIGDTISYSSNSSLFLRTKRAALGDIFRTTLDLSGSLFRAKSVVVIFDTPHLQLSPSNAFKMLGHSGLYGHSASVAQTIHILTTELFSRPQYVDKWEEVFSVVIRNYLRQLIFENTFSLADKTNV